MMSDLTKYRYETFDLSDASNLSPQARAQLESAKKEAQFAKDVAAKIEAETPPEPEVTFTEEQMEAAKKAAFAQGKAEGMKEANEQHKQAEDAEKLRAETLLLKIEAQIAGHAKKAEDHRVQVAEKLKTLAFAAAKKVVKSLPDSATKQIENFIDGALGVISEGQKVELVLNPKTAHEFIEKMDARFESLNIKEDDSILPNDLKILWNNGYAERKLDELWKEIGQIVVGEFNPKQFEVKSEPAKVEPMAEKAPEVTEETNNEEQQTNDK